MLWLRGPAPYEYLDATGGFEHRIEWGFPRACATPTPMFGASVVAKTSDLSNKIHGIGRCVPRLLRVHRAPPPMEKGKESLTCPQSKRAHQANISVYKKSWRLGAFRKKKWTLRKG